MPSASRNAHAASNVYKAGTPLAEYSGWKPASGDGTVVRTAHGFTLIELMIVVAIIAILTAIALPAYNNYRIRSSEGACQMEMKNYANMSLARLHDGEVPFLAPRRACRLADDATAMNIPITGTPQSPGVRVTTCNMATANCVLP